MIAAMDASAVQRSRELAEQVDLARLRVLRSMLGSATQIARMLDAQRAAAIGHEHVAASLTEADRPLIAARARQAAERWQQLAARTESRCSRPPAIVLRLLGRPAGPATPEAGAAPARLSAPAASSGVRRRLRRAEPDRWAAEEA